ncbi:MAG TPA: hypothetical protein VHF25_07400 [Nitriliruptorales bacterium]|nr:hypothetical protein [Nitriliruptorales bacterium]
MSDPESAEPAEEQEDVARESRATGGDAPAAGSIGEREDLAQRDLEHGRDDQDGDGEGGDGDRGG